MTALYITSISENAGKTMICAGLGKSWLNSGKRVGYLKILISPDKEKSAGANRDAAFLQRIFGLNGQPETLISTPSGIKEVYSRASQGKDLVIVEGLPLNASNNLIEALDARVLAIHDYSVSISAALPGYKALGKRLLGILLNKVPQSKLNRLQSDAAKQLGPSGIKLLGIIPEDRTLLALTVAELAEAVQGKILNNADNSGELIENFMLGALAFDSGVDYFNRKNNKAVILKGDRPDMQLAALQTSTRCMVLSGGILPIPMVALQAKSKNVPLISAAGNVQGLVTGAENAATGAKFNQEKKLPRLLEILSRNLDYKSLDQGLGLAS